MFFFALTEIKSDSDRQLIDSIYRAYRNMMFYQASLVLGNDTETEDVLTECWIALCKHVSTLRELQERSSEDLRRYLSRSVKNTALNYVKAKGRKPEVLLAQYDERLRALRGREYTASGRDSREKTEEIKNLFRALPIAHSEILQMKYTDRMDDKQIATHFGLQKDSVRAYVSAARRKAREVLQEMRRERYE